MTFLIAWLKVQGADVFTVVVTWVALGFAVMASPVLWRDVLRRGRGGGALALSMLTVGLGALAPAVTTGLAGAVVSALLFGASFFIPPASVTALSRKLLPQEMWGRTVALYTVVFAVGQIIGPIGAGWLSDASGSLRSGLVASALILLAGSGLSLLQKTRIARPR
jgi:predicted MFS family arabinose efflux permease